jgi:hypothetical protein
MQALRNNIEKVKQALSTPNNTILAGVIAVRYPDETPQPRPRKPLSEKVCLNRYGKSCM